jgi:hypothetical protein
VPTLSLNTASAGPLNLERGSVYENINRLFAAKDLPMPYSREYQNHSPIAVRLTFVALILSLILAAAATSNLLVGAQRLTATLASSSVGWPMDGFNSQRTNRSTSAGPSTLPNFQTIATNVSGVIRRIGSNDVLILTGTDSVSSFSSSEQLIWSTDVPGTIDVTIASTGTVYVSSAGSVLALNNDNGAILWTYNRVAESRVALRLHLK